MSSKLPDYLRGAVTGLNVRQGKKGVLGGGDSGKRSTFQVGPQEQV